MSTDLNMDIQPPPKDYIQYCYKLIDHLPVRDVPLECKVYQHTVAGQGVKNESKGVVLTDSKNNRVFKPLQNVDKGPMEIAFYYKVLYENDPLLRPLRDFIPMLEPTIFQDRTLNIDKLGFTGNYICLYDALKNLKHPSVCDLKIGALSYIPGSTDEKVTKQITKYPHRKDVGFYMPGMRIFDPDTGKYKILAQTYGRKLTKEDVFEKGILKFLSSNPLHRHIIARVILCKLLKLRQWFEEQVNWTFVSSSLLLAYEGDASAWKNIEDSNTFVEDLVVVKSIDFTHTYPTEVPQRDENYLFGLNNLISHFQRAANDS